MSRSNPQGGNNSPIKKYLSFSGGSGSINYWDKTKGTDGERIELDSIDFVVLDVRNSISGFEESTSSSFASNMVVNTGKDVINVVKWKKGKTTDVASGLFKDIKDTLKGTGAKFTANIISLADIDGEKQIVNLQLSGAALNDWIKFTTEHSNNKYYDYRITITKGELSKREEGETVPVTKKEQDAVMAKLAKNPLAPKPVWFYTAALTFEELTPEEVDEALAEDAKVQEYFSASTATPAATETTDTTKNVTGAPAPNENPFAGDDDDDLPF